MPRRPAQACATPGCPAIVHDRRYCDQHQRKPTTAEFDKRRGSASQRGYGVRWRRWRLMFLRRHTLCADPFGVHNGVPVAATDVDHITPKADGGTDDDANLQALCHSCHSRKTARGRGVKNRQVSERGPTLESSRAFSRN